MSIVRPLLAAVIGSTIAVAAAIACLAIAQGVGIDPRGNPNMYLVVWALSCASLVGGVVGCSWPHRHRWLPAASVAVAYVGIIVPNWYRSINRAHATAPGSAPWFPTELPWHYVGLVFVTTIVITTLSASASSQWRRRRPPGANSVGQTG